LSNVLAERGTIPPTFNAKLEVEFEEITKQRPIVIKSAIELANAMHVALWFANDGDYQFANFRRDFNARSNAIDDPCHAAPKSRATRATLNYCVTVFL